MKDELKKNLYIKFKDGYSRFLKIIRMKKGIKISPFNELYEFSVHPNRTHLKKINQKKWKEPLSEKKNKYLYIDKADFDKIKGVNALSVPLYINGLTIRNDLPIKGDVILEVDQYSTARIQFYLAYSNDESKIITENMKLNNINRYVLIKINSKNIIVGVK